jgi:hypothetical protein
MTIAPWPGSVAERPLRGSFRVLAPFRAPDRTDMEDGPPRRLRASTKNIATIGFTLRLTSAEFATFKRWVRDTLVDGTLSFSMNVWTGAAYELRTCSFAADYQGDAGDGMNHDVALTLDVEDY